MKRWTKTAAVVSATALIGLAAPAASATEAVDPGDAPGCTTVLLGEANGWVPTAMPSHLVDVSYTPPSTVTVSADRGVNWATYIFTNISGDVVAYVMCVA